MNVRLQVNARCVKDDERYYLNVGGDLLEAAIGCPEIQGLQGFAFRYVGRFRSGNRSIA
jgi:hypothetical protein